jgi:hypothetical protein
MTLPASRPRLVVVVANGITGDSRVQKTALAAARAGWAVFLVGVGTGTQPEISAMGPVQVVRVPVASTMRQSASASIRLRRLITQFGLSSVQDLAQYKAKYEIWERSTTARIQWIRSRERAFPALEKAARQASRGLFAVIKARRSVHQLRAKAFKWEQRRGVRPTGD